MGKGANRIKRRQEKRENGTKYDRPFILFQVFSCAWDDPFTAVPLPLSSLSRNSLSGTYATAHPGRSPSHCIHVVVAADASTEDWLLSSHNSLIIRTALINSTAKGGAGRLNGHSLFRPTVRVALRHHVLPQPPEAGITRSDDSQALRRAPLQDSTFCGRSSHAASLAGNIKVSGSFIVIFLRPAFALLPYFHCNAHGPERPSTTPTHNIAVGLSQFIAASPVGPAENTDEVAFVGDDGHRGFGGYEPRWKTPMTGTYYSTRVDVTSGDGKLGPNPTCPLIPIRENDPPV
ncbi:hypothetical protein BDK51DRAFT_31806 [Blyttiomyces helicus]|uniref:Uncharacterized protein n=1 Tax=Blyttiomyces helicus TaxID=388810 RepID=A0A4P9W8W2_9FUNG|nr:hypothetical protein BDK51DRAFT_31806 [Blyttiomyces helicus]|eukprot:RKO87230.1 hypothetical protein BDK51DRAFT_31806 [Blyttiomyces helicus]